MSREEIRAAVIRNLESIAPDADTSSLDPSASFREELDIDSMDFLRFVTALHDELHVDIPEADYPKVGTIEACVTYIARKVGTS